MNGIGRRARDREPRARMKRRTAPDHAEPLIAGVHECEAHLYPSGDYELDTSNPPVLPRTHDPLRGLWFFAAALVGAVLVAMYAVGRESSRTAPPRVAAAAAPVRPVTRERSPDPAIHPIARAPIRRIELPPLDETDALVRRLVGTVSTHPGIARWLATDGLIRRFVVAVGDVVSGRTPARHFRALGAPDPFRIFDRDGHAVIDPGSYDRYHEIADIVDSIDPGGAARVYATLRPRIEQAYRELGDAGSFDGALDRAIVALLQVPVLEGDVAVAPKGAIYTYADPRLEQLTAAQRQLMRSGPRNVRVIQGKLRALALELGIRPVRLALP
jgi:hypothetical protein